MAFRVSPGVRPPRHIRVGACLVLRRRIYLRVFARLYITDLFYLCHDVRGYIIFTHSPRQAPPARDCAQRLLVHALRLPAPSRYPRWEMSGMRPCLRARINASELAESNPQGSEKHVHAPVPFVVCQAQSLGIASIARCPTLPTRLSGTPDDCRCHHACQDRMDREERGWCPYTARNGAGTSRTRGTFCATRHARIGTDRLGAVACTRCTQQPLPDERVFCTPSADRATLARSLACLAAAVVRLFCSLGIPLCI